MHLPPDMLCSFHISSYPYFLMAAKKKHIRPATLRQEFIDHKNKEQLWQGEVTKKLEGLNAGLGTAAGHVRVLGEKIDSISIRQEQMNSIRLNGGASVTLEQALQLFYSHIRRRILFETLLSAGTKFLDNFPLLRGLSPKIRWVVIRLSSTAIILYVLLSLAYDLKLINLEPFEVFQWLWGTYKTIKK